MAMETVIQTSSIPEPIKIKTVTSNNQTTTTTTSQLSTISLMLEYEIDNTLNTIKENSHLLSKMIQEDAVSRKIEINNNSNKVAEELSEKKLSNSTFSAKVQQEQHQHEQQQVDQGITTNARKRWKILAKVLRKDSSEESVPEGSGSCDDDENDASVRRFKSFDLLRQDSLDDTTEIDVLNKPENWYTYRIRIDNEIEYFVNIHHIERHLTASDLMGFNNTGNICVWPSEEALTVYVLSNIQMFRNKWILELGGGMTSLAGLMLAKYSKAYLVHLTDGNEISMENVRRTLCLNKLSCYTKYSVLKWEDCTSRLNSDYEKFDWILSADCLFFDEARLSLIDTIWYYLSQNGVALIMAPKRGKTLKIFVDECSKKGFQYQIVHRYNDIIWKRHLELISTSNLYDEDIHYPILIKLTKIKKNTGAIVNK